jgi:hypothetical protein
LSQSPSDWNPQPDCGAANVGGNLDLTTRIASPFPHAAQTMPIVIPDKIESRAIVNNF